MPPKITKKDIAAKSHKPHGGTKDRNEHAKGNKDGKTLRKLNAAAEAGAKKRGEK